MLLGWARHAPGTRLPRAEHMTQPKNTSPEGASRRRGSGRHHVVSQSQTKLLNVGVHPKRPCSCCGSPYQGRGPANKRSRAPWRARLVYSGGRTPCTAAGRDLRQGKASKDSSTVRVQTHCLCCLLNPTIVMQWKPMACTVLHPQPHHSTHRVQR